jgi:hypothetical protein
MACHIARPSADAVRALQSDPASLLIAAHRPAMRGCLSLAM